MALKVELKPGERLLLGGCVITNADQRARLLIEGNVPILREKDIMTAERADSPAKRIYLSVQLMYLADDARPHHDVYFQLVRDVVKAAPSALPIIDEINNLILTGHMYKALKQAARLIEYEKELIDHAKRGTSVRKSRERHSEPA